MFSPFQHLTIRFSHVPQPHGAWISKLTKEKRVGLGWVQGPSRHIECPSPDSGFELLHYGTNLDGQFGVRCSSGTASGDTLRPIPGLPSFARSSEKWQPAPSASRAAQCNRQLLPTSSPSLVPQGPGRQWEWGGGHPGGELESTGTCQEGRHFSSPADCCGGKN